MTPEELLNPRYKVIVDYPEMECEVGDIFHKLTFDNGNYTYVTNPESPLQGYIIGHMIERMPHLFKPLAWWEERQPEEMPKYVKIGQTRDEDEDGLVDCIAEIINLSGINGYGKHLYLLETIKAGKISFLWPIEHLLPATLEEYEAYLKSQT